MIKYLIYILILINTLNLSAFDIKGIVSDKETNEPLRAVTIKLNGTAYGAFSDANGEFIIRRVPAGAYTIIFKMIGYESLKMKIDIPQDSGKVSVIKLSGKSLRTNEVVVSANKRVQQVQEVPVSVSTIDLTSLTNKNITDIDKALEYIPGVKMNGDHVSIRGSSGFAFGVGSKVAYLLDGFPLLSGDQGDLKFDLVPVFNIERIEVVKGAGSALYGTGALGGVINVITEEPKEKASLKTKLYSGIYTKPKYDEWIYSNNYSFNSGIDLSYSQKFGILGVLVSGRYLNDESYRQFDKRTNINLFTKLKFDFSDKNKFTLSTSYAANDRDDWVYWRSLDSATIPPSGTDMSAKIFSDKLIATGLYEHFYENGDFLIIRTGLYQTYFENTLDKSNPDYRTSTAISNSNELQLNNRLTDDLFLTSGINYVYNTVEANVYSNNTQVSTAVYSQAEYKVMEPLIVTLGGRFDYEKTTGSNENYEISPKLGVLYKSPWDANLRASLGKGFRTATIAEKFAKINYGPFKVIQNPDISPETSWSYEIGFNKDFKLLNQLFIFDISAFQNDMNNMIEAEFVGASIQFNNISKARIQGLEIDMKSMLFDFIGFQTSLTLINPKDLTPKAEVETLKYRSKILWYSGISIPFGLLDFEMDYRFLSRSDEVDEMLERFVPDAGARVNAHIADARLIFHLKDITGYDMNIVLNANNLFDYYYSMYPGNLAPTRNITLQLDARF